MQVPSVPVQSVENRDVGMHDSGRFQTVALNLAMVEQSYICYKSIL